MAVAEAIPAETLLESLREAGVQDVIIVPDTHQRTLIALLEDAPDIRLIRATNENEAVAIGAGLIVGGRRPLLQIQHAGLFACVNYLRGIGIDGRFPLVLLIGLLGRDPAKAPREDFSSMVRLAQPLLDALEIPCRLLEHRTDVDALPRAFQEAEERAGPIALLVGVETG